MSIRRNDRPWTIRGRIAATVWLLGLAPACLLSFVGTRALGSIINTEYTNLVREELFEAAQMLAAKDRSETALKLAIQRIQEQHPNTHVTGTLRHADTAFRATGTRTTSTRTTSAGITPERRELLITQVSDDHYTGHIRVDPKTTLDISVNGQLHSPDLTHFRNYNLLLLLSTPLFSVVAATIISQRLKRLFRRVESRLSQGQESSTDLPTELQQVYQQLASTLRATRAQADRTQLLTAGLAHELRTPLQIIMSEAELGRRSCQSLTDAKTRFSSILDDLKNLSRGIDNLLFLCTQSSIDSAHFDETTLQAVTRDLASESRLAALKNQHLTIQPAPARTLVASHHHLVQALKNILSNAMQYTPTSGQILFESKSEDGTALFSCDDSGPGFSEQMRIRALLPFTRGTDAQRKRTGFGLGLAVAEAVARMHGGQLSVTTSHLGGARVSMSIPARDPQ